MTQTQDQTRSRTFTWSDPALHASLLGQRGGLDLMRASAAGEVPPPPIMDLVGLSGMEVDEGAVTFYLEPQEFHYNPLGTVHGGIISTLLDSACGCSVHTTLPPGVGYTSLDLNVKFLRPITVDTGRLTTTGAVLQKGRRTALAEAKMFDAKGRLLAHATSSCMLFEIPSA